MRVRIALAAAVLAAPVLSAAADVAVLKSTDTPAWRPAIDALRRGAGAHAVTEHDLRNDRAEADRVIAGLKGKAAVMVAMGPLAAQAAREGAPEIPLVFCMVQDPARLGLAGAPNVTGVSFQIPIKNQLAAFRLVNPRAVKIGAIYSEANTGPQVAEATKSAGVVRLNVVGRPVASERDVPEALRGLLKGGDAVDALWIPPDPILLGDESRRYILAETLKAGKPVYSFSSALVAEGALVSNGPDMGSIGDQAAELVNRIAGGEKGKIEMLVPRAELVINKKIADKLKVDVPIDALKAAGKVF
ncbi:MAG TPA: ABC transporter substrate-binding protein [Vicinamibacteria bacterium]|nr:ABC transporter substrate-binding protein [Vicinamibacteria bacterium]